MESFIKENWFKISIVIVLLAIVLSAIYYFFFFIPAQQNNKVQTSDIALQAKCATQAEIALDSFKKYSESQYNYFVQQNHYNPSLSKCFVLINYSPKVPSGTQIDTDAKAYEYPTTIETLEDAYENSDLADCAHYGNLIGVDPNLVNSNPESSKSCLIGNNKVTYTQYKNFVLSRMEMPDPAK